MQQQISVITLCVADIARYKRFYVEGFGWKPVFDADGIVFYQMNGLMLGTWLASALDEDSRRTGKTPGAFSVAQRHEQAGGAALDRQAGIAGGKRQRQSRVIRHAASRHRTTR